MAEEDAFYYTKSLEELDTALAKTKTKTTIQKFVFGLLFLVFVFVIILYFCLPSFRVSSMNIDGLVYLTADQYRELAGISSSSSLLFFDAQEANDTATEKAGFLILDGKAYSNPFYATTEVLENRPLFRYGTDTYFLNGQTYFELQSKIASLGTAYSTTYSNLISNESFPEVHIPANQTIESNQTNLIYMTFYSLQYINPSSLSKLAYVQFMTSSYDTTNSSFSTCDLFFTYDELDDTYIQFSSILIEDFEDIFAFDVSEMLDECYSYISEENATFTSYTFLDDSDSSIDCYSFDISLSSDSELRIIPS